MVVDERYFMIYCIVYRYLCTSKIETITLTIMNKSSKLSIIPVMLCFFAMGFVDLVGIASNYVKEDLNLNDATANLFPSLVFFWFLIFSVPTGILMNKIGRKKTVLLSLLVTVISLLLPIFGENFELMLVSFSLLGIGNALMQTSLNPLVSVVTSGQNLASTLTFGQFVKAIASFLAPYIAMWGAMASIPTFGLGWRILFPIYMVIGIAATFFLAGTPIEEEKNEGKASGFGECFKLLGKPIVLLSFIGIMCHVGIDVGTNTTGAPEATPSRAATPRPTTSWHSLPSPTRHRPSRWPPTSTPSAASRCGKTGTASSTQPP